jgi:preprotein translocase subunit SecD
VPLDRNVFGREGLRLGLDLAGGSLLVYQADLTHIEPDNEAEAMKGVRGVIERRINALGIAEPVIELHRGEGEHRIAIQLPGIAEAERAREVVGLVNVLEFREELNVAGNWTPATGTVTVNGTVKTLPLTSRYFRENTFVTIDELTRRPLLVFEWDETGQVLSEQITRRLLNRPRPIDRQLAIYLGDEPLRGEDDRPIAPIVEEVIRDRGQITGLSLTDAHELSRLLNAGRIDVPLGRWVNGEFEPGVPIFEWTVDAELGADSINKSMVAAVIGIILLLAFMILYYRLPGLVACLSLAIYGVVLLSIFKLVPITLTLPGLAAFIVSLGMAVDANVLIFERIKEELRGGRSLAAAVEAGFNRAWTAIRDSNITTFIACIVLFWLGGTLGAFMVRGFALILFMGVALSMFTAITVTRTLLRLITSSQAVTNLAAYGITPLQTVRNTK